jgi:E3 ubiquitin-protein ligase DOA10
MSSSLLRVCAICLEAGEEGDSSLNNFCNCTTPTHDKCLYTWLDSSRATRCNVCNCTYVITFQPHPKDVLRRVTYFLEADTSFRARVDAITLRYFFPTMCLILIVSGICALYSISLLVESDFSAGMAAILSLGIFLGSLVVGTPVVLFAEIAILYSIFTCISLYCTLWGLVPRTRVN